MRHQGAFLQLRDHADVLGALATDCLVREVETYPKPGLVSHVDAGAHADMDAALLRRSAHTLAPFFVRLAKAGAAQQSMDVLRQLGMAAEQAVMRTTCGVNTHRGAIFGLGLLVAAAGLRLAHGGTGTLGATVARRWGAQLQAGPILLHSHGTRVKTRYKAGGARKEAQRGFASLYQFGLPGLHAGRLLAKGNEQAARVQACMALLAEVEDTNLLHRGGPGGLAFAQAAARHFLAAGGVGAPGWQRRAERMHRAFVARRLSPGGCADLLAMTLFVDGLTLR